MFNDKKEITKIRTFYNWFSSTHWISFNDEKEIRTVLQIISKKLSLYATGSS